MNDVIDLVGIKSAIEGISEQISTAINIDKVSKRLTSGNILHNWYFPRPINQRCVSGKITAKGYFIDRWKLVDGEVTLTDEGLVLNGVIQQPLEYPVNNVTVSSVLTPAGPLPDEQVEYEDERQIFQITGTGETLIAAKLELGDQQTLCNKVDGQYLMRDPAPDPSVEMLVCQRYLFSHTYWYDLTTANYAGNGAGVRVYTTVPLRGNITMIMGNNKLWYTTDRSGGWMLPTAVGCEYDNKLDSGQYAINVTQDFTFKQGSLGGALVMFCSGPSGGRFGQILFSAEL